MKAALSTAADAAAAEGSGRPYSIVGRLTGLLVGVGVATALLHAAAVFLHVRPIADALVDHVGGQVRAVQSALQAVPEGARDALAAAMSGGQLRISRWQPGDDPELPPDALPPGDGGPLVERLRAATGHAVRVEPGPPEEDHRLRWTVLLPVEGQTWQLAFDGLVPSTAATTLAVVGTLVLVAAAGMLAQWVGVRLITRPMSRLAAELMDRRQGLQPIAEPARVSVELRGVIRSFNSLVHALGLAAMSRRDLLAGVSHDIRTPLARLKLRVETEGGDALAARAEPDFAALGRIVDQFLAYAQGQDALPVGRPQRLAALVGAVVDGYRGQGADVRVLRADDAGVEVPDTGMRRALTNLVDNAHAHGRGPVEVELWPGHHELSLVVWDRGPGIAQADLAQAMSPFVRLGRGGAHEGHCGLGLAIVGQVAGQLGGRVVVHPHDGRRWGIGIALPLRG